MAFALDRLMFNKGRIRKCFQVETVGFESETKHRVYKSSQVPYNYPITLHYCYSLLRAIVVSVGRCRSVSCGKCCGRSGHVCWCEPGECLDVHVSVACSSVHMPVLSTLLIASLVGRPFVSPSAIMSRLSHHVMDVMFLLSR